MTVQRRDEGGSNGEPAARGIERPTIRGRETEKALQDAARRVIARKGYLNTTIVDITKEARRSPASFYNYYDSKEDLLSRWAEQFQHEAEARSRLAYRHGAPHREVILQSVRAHWDTYKEHLAEMIGVFQVSMINEEFATRWRDLRAVAVSSVARGVRRAQADGYCPGLEPVMAASAIVSMLNQFCFVWLAQDGEAADVELDERDAVEMLAELWYRMLYWRADDVGPGVARSTGRPD